MDMFPKIIKKETNHQKRRKNKKIKNNKNEKESQKREKTSQIKHIEKTANEQKLEVYMGRPVRPLDSHVIEIRHLCSGRRIGISTPVT